MRLTPLDIQSHHFARRLRGLDASEVEAFLRMVAEDFEGVIRECDRQRERIRDLEARVADMASREETLRATLMTAQEVSEDLRRTAAKEAEVLLAEAEVKAEKVLDAAHRRVAKLAEDIREMRQLRTRIGSAVRGAIETHLQLLEGLSADGPEDPLLDGKVAFLAAPKTAAKRPVPQSASAAETTWRETPAPPSHKAGGA
jgi:cell division initiation protein